MRKILLLFVVLSLLCQPCWGASQWSKTNPAGNTLVSDIDYWVATINNEAVDRLLLGYRESCVVKYASVSTLTVTSGEIAIPDATEAITKYRRNTSDTAVTWANIDAGVEAVSTQYYVYALADSDATTFTVKFSTSATAPTGATYYKKIGTFYNNASGNIDESSVINYNNSYGLKLGTWVSKTVSTVYQASTDGFATGYGLGSAGDINGYTDSSNPPTTTRVYYADDGYVGGVTMPVKKGDYYKITSGAALTMFWIPLEKEI